MQLQIIGCGHFKYRNGDQRPNFRWIRIYTTYSIGRSRNRLFSEDFFPHSKLRTNYLENKLISRKLVPVFKLHSHDRMRFLKLFVCHCLTHFTGQCLTFPKLMNLVDVYAAKLVPPNVTAFFC